MNRRAGNRAVRKRGSFREGIGGNAASKPNHRFGYGCADATNSAGIGQLPGSFAGYDQHVGTLVGSTGFGVLRLAQRPDRSTWHPAWTFTLTRSAFAAAATPIAACASLRNMLMPTRSGCRDLISAASAATNAATCGVESSGPTAAASGARTVRGDGFEGAAECRCRRPVPPPPPPASFMGLQRAAAKGYAGESRVERPRPREIRDGPGDDRAGSRSRRASPTPTG